MTDEAAIACELTAEAAEVPAPAWRKWVRPAAVGASVLVGLLLVLVADVLARRGAPSPEALFWIGLTTMFAPAVAALMSRSMSRREALSIVVVVAFGLYCVKLLHAPTAFTAYDELLHYRTLDDLTQTGRLFTHNPLLPVSPYYPGLEIVTSMLMNATGLSAFAAARVVIGVARLLMTLSLFLFFERLAPSPQAAALGALLYAGEPTYLFFDSQFAYESLAVPLAVFCLFLLDRALSEEGRDRHLLELLALGAGLAVVVTHHVTWFVLTSALLVWTALALALRLRRKEPIPGHGWVAPLLAVAGAAWMLMVARVTIGYLGPHIVSSFREILSLIAREGGGRKLFQTTSGNMAPLLERLVGIGSQGIIVSIIPFALYGLWKGRKRDALLLFLVLGTLSYPAVTLLRLTWHGGEIARRAAAFLFVPLAIALAFGVERIRAMAARLRPEIVLVPALAVVFAGGVIAGTAPPERLPRPYEAGSWQASVADQGAAAAEWARTVLGPGNRIAADSVNTVLLGSYGRQRVVTSDDDVSTCELFLETPFGDHHRQILGRGDVRYMLVDRRIAGAIPAAGYFYQKWERDVIYYGSTVPTATLEQLDGVTGASRVFDSGDIQLYDVGGPAK